MRSAAQVAREIVSAFHKRGNTGLTQLEYDIAAALNQARVDALEEAARMCVQTGDAYREIQVRAREAGDTQNALVHLCEKDTAFLLAREIRALAAAKRGAP